MKFVKQQGETCLVASLAMVLDVTFEQVVEWIGHDGTEIVIGETGMKGIHPQEVLDAVIKHNFTMIIIEFKPCYKPRGKDTILSLWTPKEELERFLNHLKNCNTVLIGEYNGQPHAVAYDGQRVFDPTRGCYNLEDFTIKEAWQFYPFL